jgi:hypothetical protein
MAASNFYKKNASFYYVFVGENDWDYEDFYFRLMFELEKINYSWKQKREWIKDDAFIIARKYINFYYGKDKIVWGTLIIYAIVRIGYYGGINLDWDWEFEFTDGGYCDGDDFSSSEIEDYGYYLKNNIPYWWSEDELPVEYYLGKYLIRNCSKLYDKVMDVLDKETKELEKVFEKLTEVYDLKVVFSNGAAVYEKVRKDE